MRLVEIYCNLRCGQVGQCASGAVKCDNSKEEVWKSPLGHSLTDQISTALLEFVHYPARHITRTPCASNVKNDFSHSERNILKKR